MADKVEEPDSEDKKARCERCGTVLIDPVSSFTVCDECYIESSSACCSIDGDQ